MTFGPSGSSRSSTSSTTANSGAPVSGNHPIESPSSTRAPSQAVEASSSATLVPSVAPFDEIGPAVPSTHSSSSRSARSRSSRSSAAAVRGGDRSWASANIPPCRHGPSNYLCSNHYDQYASLTRRISWGRGNQGPGTDIPVIAEGGIGPTLDALVQSTQAPITAFTRSGPLGQDLVFFQPIYWKRYTEDATISMQEMATIDNQSGDDDHCCVCVGVNN